MARKYKRDSSGRFAGGGGKVNAPKVSRALAKVGIKTKKYKAAATKAKAAQKKVDDRRLNRQLKTLEKMERRDAARSGKTWNY